MNDFYSTATETTFLPVPTPTLFSPLIVNTTTETALLLALDNIYSSVDQDPSTLLVSLDLSSAFDTIDHNILLIRLHTCFGITDTAFS